jgi:hypothetical protein
MCVVGLRGRRWSAIGSRRRWVRRLRKLASALLQRDCLRLLRRGDARYQPNREYRKYASEHSCSIPLESTTHARVERRNDPFARRAKRVPATRRVPNRAVGPQRVGWPRQKLLPGALHRFCHRSNGPLRGLSAPANFAGYIRMIGCRGRAAGVRRGRNCVIGARFCRRAWRQGPSFAGQEIRDSGRRTCYN